MSPAFVESPTREVTEDLVQELIRQAGYVHPLFQKPGAPLPGQAVLLLMGGLAEQSGALDHAIALLEFESVRFPAMLTAGNSLTVRIEALDSRTTSTGKVVQKYLWTGHDGTGAILAEARVVMLMSPLEGKNH